MINVDSSKPIKSKTLRSILIIGLIIVLVLIGIGLSTDKLDSVGGVKFHHEAKPDSAKVSNTRVEKNENGIEIQNMHGDVVTDSATKNVYNFSKPNDTDLKN